MARWITVANRLPFSMSADSNSISTSSGGLVSALSGVKTSEKRLWLGCAPEGLTPQKWTSIREKIPTNGWQYHPVFAPSDLYDSYYNGCCNDVFWPLLHYQNELVQFKQTNWEAYRDMNRLIAEEISRVAKSNDLIWIHDFHLFLVPKLLKSLRPELRLGFFLHVPFPSSEMFRQLPVREEVLDSLLYSDLVGFHDYSYLRHFCSSVLRLIGVDSSFLSIKRGGHNTRLGVFPVGIDTAYFAQKSQEAKVKAICRRLEKPIFLFLGVDRLDYMKGLDLKLKAFRAFLRRFPQYREKVQLLQVAIPSRTGVPVYRRLANEIARLVGEINGEFSTPHWTPLHYLHSSVSQDQLSALYRTADALLVTSKRDGMNLVALEYVASQEFERPGVLLLSEFTGALSNLSHALTINPWDFEDTACKMQVAMEMPKQERTYRLETMQRYLQKYTATDWAESFISELGKGVTESLERNDGPSVIADDDQSIAVLRDKILARHADVKKVVVFLDYDGTLAPIADSPELAKISALTRRQIRGLCRYPWLDLVIVSGRESQFLEQQFDGLSLHMASEHGGKYFDPNQGKWQRRIHRNRKTWYPPALKIISDYTDRVPHSKIERKQYAIAWHYRQAPQEYAEFQAKKLAEELESGLANMPVSILRGKKVIEVRAVEADKGVFASSYLDTLATSGVVPLAIGDDKTDEDIFITLKNRGFSFKVGGGQSAADFALASQKSVMPFLQKLLAAIDTALTSSESKGVAPPQIATRTSSNNSQPTNVGPKE